jgi:hypothetical protein
MTDATPLLTPGAKIRRESLGFAVAEGVSMVTSLGVVAIADQLIPKSIMSGVCKTIGKLVIEPFLLTPLEWVESKFCRLEECQIDKSVPREKRAENMAKTILIFGAAWALSLEAKLRTRRYMNNYLGVSSHEVESILPREGAGMWEKFKHYATFSHWHPEEKMIFAADEGVHIGSMFLMNNQFSKQTDTMIKKTTDIIQKTTGMSEKKAHEISTMAWIWEVPNVLGGLAGLGAIAMKHAHNWPNAGPLKKLFGGYSNQPPT